MNGSNFVKLFLIFSATLNNEKYYRKCFPSSILANLLPSQNNYSNRVSNYRQNLDELNLLSFDFSEALKCSDIHNLD